MIESKSPFDHRMDGAKSMRLLFLLAQLSYHQLLNKFE